MDPDGSTAPRDGCKEDPSHGHRGRILTASRGVPEAGNREPKDRTLKTGNPRCGQGEDLLWWPSESPGGTNTTSGKRGSLVGAIPEALRGEAPKGQPMIHGETLAAVCVEATEGQPRNHRRHPRQVMGRPMGEMQGNQRGKMREGPPSSPSRETVRREVGGRSRRSMPGEPASSGWKRGRK